MTAVFEKLREIRAADVSDRVLGENSESHNLQALRYAKLAALLEASAGELDGPEARDTF